MNLQIALAIILISLLSFHSHAHSSVYHVSKDGNDTNPGTKFSPFKSLKMASEVLKPGDSCIVHTGIYRECFSPKNNGKKDKPIVLMAAKGEKVIISGMEPVCGWIAAENKIYKAKIPWTLGESNMVLIDNIISFEARFPNKTNMNPFDPQGGEIIEEGLSLGAESEPHDNPYRFLTNVIPDKWGDEDLKEAKVWVLAQHKWSAWISNVMEYDNKKKSLGFKPFDPGRNWVRSNHNPNFMNKNRGKNIFYLFGSKVFLDAENEWYYDKLNNELLLLPPSGRKPNDEQVEFRKRETAVDLNNKKYWHIEGFHILGATIDLSKAENCLITSCQLKYFWQSIPSQSPFAGQGNTGVIMGGANNIIQNSELSYSAGSAITISGNNNKIINNLIHHHNYLGSILYAAIIINGIDHQIKYNTIHSTGRDIIKMNGGRGEIAWNNLYNPGLICEDLGVLYSGGTDYENMQIHHNLIYNGNDSKQSVLGIYFDNFTNNGIVHHNIVWGIKEGVRLNRPGNYHQVYNNIVIEINNAYGPWQGPETQFGSAIVNNFTINPIRANDEVFKTNNFIGFPFDTLRRSSVKNALTEGINKYGFSKYVGAFPDENESWAVGHDFSRTSIHETDRKLPFMRNYIENGSFEWQMNRHQKIVDKSRIDFWEKSGEVELNYSSGFNIPGPEARNAIYGNSVLLKSDGAGIGQTVEGLKPDFPYKIGVYVRTEDSDEIILRVQSTQIHQSLSSNDFPAKAGWKLLVLPFRTGPQDEKIKVRIRKIGNSNVYLDNIGLVPDLENAKKEK